MGCQNSTNLSNNRSDITDSECIKLNNEANKFISDNSSNLKSDDIIKKIISQFDLAIKCDSLYFDPVFQKAQFLIYQKKYQEVIDMYEKFNDPIVLFQIGFCYNKMNETDSTNAYIKKALTLSKKLLNEEKSYIRLENLIMIKAGLSQIEEAEKILEKHNYMISNEQLQHLEFIIKTYKEGNMDPYFIIK